MSEMVARIGDTLSPQTGDRSRPTRGLPSTAAVAGHPIHPMIIPYPVATLTGVVVTDLIGRSTGDPFWSRASKLLLGTGVVSGLAAGAVGAIDYYTIRRAREARNGSIPTGKLHAYGNPIALALAAINLWNRGRGRPDKLSVGLSLATAALLGVTAWAGAELSYRHMVGVNGNEDQHDHREKQVVA